MAGLRLGSFKLLRCRADGSVICFFFAATVLVHRCGAIFTTFTAAVAAAFLPLEKGEGWYLPRLPAADLCRLLFPCGTPREQPVSCVRETVRAEDEVGWWVG